MHAISRVLSVSEVLMLSAVILLLVSVVSDVNASQFCSATWKQPPVSLKSIIKKSFTAEIYSVDLDKRTAMRGYEHYSDSFKKSAVYISPTHDSPYLEFFIYFLKTQAGFKNTGDGGCEEMKTDPTFGLMSWRVSKVQTATYVGTYESSGETLHNWRSCYEDDDFQYQEDLYTSQATSEWGIPSNSDYTPVKMILKKRNKSNDQKSQINHYFLRFEARDDNDKEFQGDLDAPVGYSCPHLQTMQIPSLPESIVYMSEPTDAPQNPMEYILDTKNQIIVSKGELSGSSSQFKQVDSYKLGVNFQITDQGQNKCTITPYAVLGDSQLNTSLSYKDTYGTQPFETIEQFMGNGIGFTFNGLHTCRGIECIAFSKHFDDYRGTGEATVVLYFSSDTIDKYSSVGADAEMQPVLLRKDVWKNGTVIYEHNIYNAGALDYSRLDSDVTDISACQGQMGEIEFTLLFEYKSSDSQASYEQREALKKALKAELASTAGVDELRIHLVDVLLESGKLIAQVRLLGPLAQTSYVLKTPGSIKDKSDVAEDKFVKEKPYGAHYCKSILTQTDGANFASYCKNNYMCTVYKDINPAALTYNKDCYGYFLGKVKDQPVGLDDAWDKITDAVDSGKFTVSGYKASAVAKFDASSANRLSIPNLQKYTKIPGAKIELAMDSIPYSSLVVCSDKCTESLGYQCQAFTYCEQDSLCILNPDPNTQSRNQIQANKVCDVYVRKYATEFTTMEHTSIAIDKEMVFEVVNDPDLCARLCLELTDFRCESFDYCTLQEGGGSGTCSLFRKHYFDVVESSERVVLPDTRCHHYSRNYLSDYDRKKGVTDLPISTKTMSSSPESCAQSCSSQDSTTGESPCTMFQFCPVGNICEFVDESSLSSDASRHFPKLKESQSCSTYSLKKNLFQIHGRSQSQKAEAFRALSSKLGSGGSGGYGSGVMAGLALGMLVLGACVLLFGLFVWERSQRPGGLGWFSRGGNGEMTMKFSKEDLD